MNTIQGEGYIRNRNFLFKCPRWSESAEAAIVANEALTKLVVEEAKDIDARRRQLRGGGSFAGNPFGFDPDATLRGVLERLGLLGLIPGRFKGGGVEAGKAYFVGEDRRTGAHTPNTELFVPDQSGQIIPAPDVSKYISANLSASALKVTRASGSIATHDSALLREMRGLRQAWEKHKGETINTVNISGAGDSRADDLAYRMQRALLEIR